MTRRHWIILGVIVLVLFVWWWMHQHKGQGRPPAPNGISGGNLG